MICPTEGRAEQSEQPAQCRPGRGRPPTNGVPLLQVTREQRATAVRRGQQPTAGHRRSDPRPVHRERHANKKSQQSCQW